MKKYFIRPADRQGSCYYEFHMGAWGMGNNHFWKEDSICISDDDFVYTGFEEIVADVVEEYDPYGNTPVTNEQWELIVQKAEIIGGNVWVAVNEAKEWATQNFQHHQVFTILGM